VQSEQAPRDDSAGIDYTGRTEHEHIARQGDGLGNAWNHGKI